MNLIGHIHCHSAPFRYRTMSDDWSDIDDEFLLSIPIDLKEGKSLENDLVSVVSECVCVCVSETKHKINRDFMGTFKIAQLIFDRF